jgi:cytochrome c553
MPRKDAIGAVLAALAVAACGGEGEPTTAPPRAAEAPAVVDPTAEALRLSGDPQAGAQLYQTCAVCHLPSGAGRDDGTFPRLAGQHASVIIKQVIDIREGRRRDPVMHPYVELGGLQEIADVAAYIATLPPVDGAGTGDGAELARGRELYARDCARCHGARGEGDAAGLVPALSEQHYAYLLRQLRYIAGGRRRDAHPEMVAAARPYTDAELRAVADYLSRGAQPAR